MYSSPHARLHGCSNCLYACCPFFSRNSLNALQTDNNSVLFIQFMFGGDKYVLDPSQNHVNPRLAA